MRIQKLLLITSIAGLSTFLAVAQSSDSEAQEKALKALREKMKELDSAKPATPAPVSTSRPQQTPAPVVPAKTVQMDAPKTSVAGGEDAQAKALEALRRKQAELDAQQKSAGGKVATSPDAEAQAKAQAVAMEALRAKQRELEAQPGTDRKNAEAEAARARAAAADAARVAKAAQREAEASARQAKAQANAVKQQSETKSPSVAAVAVVSSPAPMIKAAPAAAAGLSADQVVGSSLGRREKLDALLSLYLADVITPREYHQHRAAIIAQP